MRRTLLIAGIILIPLIPIVLVVSGVLKAKPKTVNPVHLVVWTTNADADGLKTLVAQYRATRPYVTIDITTVSAENYSQQLISAWAQGTGPDIFFVPSPWIGQMSQYATAMPSNLTVPQVIASKGILGTTTKVVENTRLAPTQTEIANSYAGTVPNDIVRDGQTWGLPFSLDTLVVYYNKDLLNNAKIFQPAATWSELQNQLTSNHLTVVDTQGRLVQSGVALGTANNLPYAADLLSLLMMQNGSVMTTADKRASINDDAGLQALKFYLSFAQLSKSNYSWDEQQTNARDAFLQGKVAYYFGTYADRVALASSNVNWGVTPMFHIRATGDNDGVTGTERFIDAAEYSVAMVSKASVTAGTATQAWNFLVTESSADNVAAYVTGTGQLSAQRAILAQQGNDEVLGVYAKQILTTKNWYHGNDAVAVETYLKQLITNGLAGKTDLTELLNTANAQVQTTL